ncbi:MAG: NADH-quinone oxidoreductase subunit N [Cyclobacteriaceae bacterium]|nr:NADH-quinone oxidoreductase subunit N [Cyclobacteriaceae bacterium]UYN87863.1 MAG: NADH-quinone oxidoreductase subunit N [Cyclobacteriaceae bacterium]
MSLNELMIMRHEWALVAVVLLLLIFEIALPDDGKKKINFIAAILVAAVTIIGFLPAESGSLFGGMYVTDPLRMFMKNILNIGVLLIILQSVNWLSQELYNDRSSEFYMLTFSSLIGVSYMISSGHFLMFYLGLELTTIPIAALASYEQFKTKSAEAGIKLILSSAFSSAILLFGISVLFAANGNLYFESFQLSDSVMNILGFIFFFSGLAFKISIVPFHLWTADVYEGSPTNVTSYLSVISKGSAIFILVIVLFTVFNSIQMLWQDVLYATAILTMTIGNLFAIRQQNLKRFLAFSSIAQAGFIMLGVINASALGMATVIYFIVVYVFSNLAAFGVIQTVGHASGKVTIDDYNGLYKTNPQLSLVMMLALFSLAGIPPLAGFFGKFFLFTAVAESGFYVLLMIAVLNAVISLYYYLLVVKAMFINVNENPIAPFKSDYGMRISLVICVAGILATGFYSPVFEYIKNLCETF